MKNIDIIRRLKELYERLENYKHVKKILLTSDKCRSIEITVKDYNYDKHTFIIDNDHVDYNSIKQHLLEAMELVEKELVDTIDYLYKNSN